MPVSIHNVGTKQDEQNVSIRLQCASLVSYASMSMQAAELTL